MKRVESTSKDAAPNNSTAKWLRSGMPWIWLTAGTVSFSLIMVFGLLILITLRGMGHFWPQDVAQLELIDESAETTRYTLGEIVDRETVTAARVEALGISVPEGEDFVDRFLLKIGNRDVTGLDFKWFSEAEFNTISYPSGVVVAEREEWGNFYGFVHGVREKDTTLPLADDALWDEIDSRLKRKQALHQRIEDIEDHRMDAINIALERLRLRSRRLELDGVAANAPQYREIAAARELENQRHLKLSEELALLYEEIERDYLLAKTIDGDDVELRFDTLVRVFQPNDMNVWHKTRHYFSKIAEFVLDDPREANTEGGVFPAIFGTVLMVLLMSLFVTPFGVVAAIY